MRWWGVVIAVAFCHGCLRDDLVRCGDRYCPTTSTCMAGRCIDPQQIVACNGVAEGDGCVVLDTAGTCLGGLCEIAGRCGDGFVDMGEVCDDGNQTDGDGCSRTCASDETCGNGVLDLTETCDCGTDASNQPLGCPTVNSDETTALCDTSCSRVCGDNMVTGLEACDGTMVPATCEDFGYYSGMVTCSPFCSFVQNCTGRCGDGVLQTSEGEVCDGDSTVTDSCVDFGRDYGVLGCNQFCNPDVGGDCGFYGWNLVTEPGDVTDAQMNSHGWIANAAGILLVSYDGVETSHNDDTATRVLATESAFAKLGNTAGLKIARYLPANGTWEDLPLSQPAGTWSVRSDRESLYILDDEACSIERIDLITLETNTYTVAGASNCHAFDVLDGSIVVAGDKTYFGDGLSWIQITKAVDTVQLYGDARVVTLTNGVRHVIDFKTSSDADTLPADQILQLVTTRGGNDYAIRADETNLGHIGYVEHVLQMPQGTEAIARGGDGSLIARNAKGLYRAGPSWSTMDLARSFSEQPSGAIVEYDADDVAGISWSFGAITSVVGRPPGRHRVASSLGIYLYDTTTSSYAIDSGLTGPSKIAASENETWAIVNGTPHQLVNDVWSAKALPGGCSAIDIAATRSLLAVLANCTASGRRVYIANGAALTATGPVALGDRIVLGRSDSSIFVASSSFYQRLDAGQWTTVNFNGMIYPASFTARARDQVYFQMAGQSSFFASDGTTARRPFRHLSVLPTIVEQALALENGLYVRSNMGNGVFAWWGERPTGL